MKENRKTLYTKQVLKESLLMLLQDKSINKITVKGLCELADINRSTFYSHYTDIYDMVEKIEENIVKLIMRNIDIKTITGEYQIEVFETILNELKSNRKEIELLYLNPESMRCFEHLFEEIYKLSSELLKVHFKELDENKIKYVYSFISRGCAQMVSEWVKNNMKEEPKEMAILINKTLKGRFYY